MPVRLRGDVFHASGCLFRAVACLVQVLFALNRRYFLNEKGAVAAVDTFPLRPDGFSRIVSRVLAHPGHSQSALGASIEELESLVQSVRELAEPEAS